MKKRTTKISVLVISAIVALIIAGCFVIVSVTQPTTIQGLEQFTATVVVNVEGQSDANPHYAIAGLLIPNDWQIDSVWFTGGYTGYCTFLPANVPDNEPGGQVDYWANELETRYASGDNMKWVVYQSTTSHPVVASTVQVNLYVKMTPSAAQGNYNLGYFVTDAALDFTDPTYYSISLTNPITVSGVLPVELTSFAATTVKDGVQLKWETATETNNRGFEIQRSTGGKEFNTVGFVKGNGTTSQKVSYSFVDKSAQAGKLVYRLKQLDFGGAFEYSKLVEVNYTTPREFSLLKNFPNPFNPTTNISFTLPVESEVKLSVYNSAGQLIKIAAQGKYSAGTQNVVFDASDLPSGTYLYSISAKGKDGAEFVQTAKMLLLK